MKLPQPDIYVEVRFLMSDMGGKTKDIPPNIQYGCVFTYQNENFDCRLFLFDVKEPIKPGAKITTSIKFLFPDKIKNKLTIGDTFILWEGKKIAEGTILQIL